MEDYYQVTQESDYQSEKSIKQIESKPDEVSAPSETSVKGGLLLEV